MFQRTVQSSERITMKKSPEIGQFLNEENIVYAG
jgi:hypothetical protein